MLGSASIGISVVRQELTLYADAKSDRRYPVSTSKYGVGQLAGSFKTPRGGHVIRAKIGAGCQIGTVFVGRRPTGETYSQTLAQQFPRRDWILTRILWLSGTEPGVNRWGRVDTMRRYIYIHGMPDSAAIGVPGSIGCIRMRNEDVVELFDLVSAGINVTIG